MRLFINRNRVIWLSLFLLTPMLFAMNGCQKKESRKERPKYDGTIVAAGDSLTAGLYVLENEAYPAQLEKRLLGDGYRYRVINAGNSGETSSGLLSRMKWILSMKPDIVIIETGANDGLRGVDPELTRKNIEGAVRILKSSGVTVVLAKMQIVQNLGKEYTEAFKAIYPAVAKKEGIIMTPFYLEGVAGNPDLNEPDGIHPTAAGYRIVVDNIYSSVIEAIKREKASHQPHSNSSVPE